ncbi:IS110 family transposase [Kibdelosporangium aridum]|uniref:IS110 family transposase n=1 Tax=Kibdelosporangium aridum TaxID=2030 RepID=A0A428XNH6_KIBAR|nr:IS110 family transposase [Kibdelosporangium aridum]RSM56893.1 IS110 family transposase [Kibdelosporangium aridum]
MSEYDGRQYVGIDLHRHRSVIVRLNAAGEQLDAVRIDNDPVALMAEIGKAGPCPEVVLEATYGWYWAADALAEAGARVHLAHPLGLKGWTTRRVKTDWRDAADLAEVLWRGRLAEGWIAPPQVRGLRELVRHRAKLVQLRTGVKAGVHAVLAKQGLRIPASDLFGQRGRALLAGAPLDAPFRARVNSQCRLIDALGFEIAVVTSLITRQVAADPGYPVLQQIPGIGPTLAAVLIAEIGDIHRFRSPRQLCSWAGLTPKHHESDRTVRRGRITKQGSRLVRWATVEAAQKLPTEAGWLVATRDGIRERRGRNIAIVAVARRLLTLVFYGLRDGHIRALHHPREAE